MLRESISALSEEEIRYNPGKDKWSIYQIIIHITDSELGATHRMKKVLSEPEPLLSASDQDAWKNYETYLYAKYLGCKNL